MEIAASSKSRPARSWRVAMLLTEPHGARSIGRTRSSKVAWSWSRGARSLKYHRVGGASAPRGYSAARGRDLLTHLVKSRKITPVSHSAHRLAPPAASLRPEQRFPPPLEISRENYFIKKKNQKIIAHTSPVHQDPLEKLA